MATPAIISAFSVLNAGQYLATSVSALAAVGVLAVIVLWYNHKGEITLLRMLWRGAVIMIPILTVVAVVMVVVLGAPNLDVRLQQAFLAGLIVVLGWVVPENRLLAMEQSQQALGALLTENVAKNEAESSV